MTTTIKTKEGVFAFITQQYETGLYVAIYRCDEKGNTAGTPNQSVAKGTEEKFHKKLRQKAVRNNDSVLD